MSQVDSCNDKILSEIRIIAALKSLDQLMYSFPEVKPVLKIFNQKMKSSIC